MNLLPEGILPAFGLYLVRTSALVLAAPVFSTVSNFNGYRVGLIGSLTIVLFLAGGEPLVETPGAVSFALLAGRELVIGLMLAFVLHAVILAVKVAGHMVGQEMAFNMASQSDPVSGTSLPILAFFYETMFLLILLGLDGHLWVVRALAESYERAPVGDMLMGSGMSEFALALFSQMFVAGLTFAAPVFVLLALISVLVGFLARAVPQINVMEFSFSARIIAGFVGMLLFAPLIQPASQHLLTSLMDGLSASLDVIEVSGE